MIQRVCRLRLVRVQEVCLNPTQLSAERVGRRLASAGGLLVFLDEREQRLLLPRHIDEALDVLHEMLLDIVLVHRDDVDRQVVQHRVHVAVVELPYDVRLVVHLVERLQILFDALGFFVGWASTGGLFAQNFHFITEVTYWRSIVGRAVPLSKQWIKYSWSSWRV